MKKRKKLKAFSCFFAGFAVIINSTVLAAVPNGTVVIGDKAYDLNYANDSKNLREIYDTVKNRNGEIYIKSPTGIWFDNETSTTAAEDFVPKVTYKDHLGNTKEFAEEDGDEVKLEVLAVGIVDSNTLKIRFSKELDKESALNKENYVFNGKTLGDNDLLEIIDENTIVLKLKEKISETSSFGLEVKKDIKDRNKNPLKSKYEASEILYSENIENFKKNEFTGDLSLIDNKEKLTSKKIKGNVYLSAENAFISDVEISGTLIIDTNGKEIKELKNIKADRIIILSEGKDTLKFNNVKANELISLSKNTVEIELQNSSEINKALIKSSAVIKGEKNSFKNIILDTAKADTKVELKGTMNPNIRVRNSVNVISDIENWDKPLVIKTNSNKAVVQLKGKYSKIEILKESEVNVLQGSVISDSILVNSSAELKVDRDSEVKNVVVNTRKKNNNVTIKGRVSNLIINSKAEVELAEVEIEKLVVNTEGATISSDDKSKIETLVTNNNEYTVNGDNKLNIGEIVTTDTEDKNTNGNSGGYIGSTSISVKGIEIEDKDLELTIGDTFKLKAKVKPSKASNKKVIWISSDQNIVTIDKSGNISAVGVGQATITAMTHNKKYSAECKVTVKPIKVTGIQLSNTEVMLKPSESIELGAIITPNNATNKNVIWTVSNEDVASVENGIVTAKAVGQTSVTATTVDGNQTASCRVIVTGIKYECKTDGDKVTFILNDESIKDNKVFIKLFDVNNGNLEFYGEKQAENGQCEITTTLEKDGIYNGAININGIGKIVVYNFSID